MPAARARDVPINMEATCSPVDPDDWAVSFAMCHTPKRIYVDNITELGSNKSVHIYVERRTCRPMLQSEHDGVTHYLHDKIVCSECGCELRDTVFTPVWQRFCPMCGAEVLQ